MMLCDVYDEYDVYDAYDSLSIKYLMTIEHYYLIPIIYIIVLYICNSLMLYDVYDDVLTMTYTNE